ncbi:hypothetical protein D3C85_1341930 [compost metagenome]
MLLRGADDPVDQQHDSDEQGVPRLAKGKRYRCCGEQNVNERAQKLSQEYCDDRRRLWPR